MALSDSDILDLIHITTDAPYTIPYLSKTLNIVPKQLWDFLRTKRGQAAFYTRKSDGLIWVRPTIEGFNLIKGSQNSNYEHLPQNEPPRKRAHWTLKRARRLALQTIDVRRIAPECSDLFEKYLEDIGTKVLHLQPDPSKKLFGPPLYLAYQTRFNSVQRKIEMREKYERIWQNALNNYKRAVMVTLTTDPKQFRNLTEANKAIQKNWNKLITRMRKDSKKKLKYLCVREFQKNGRLHLHAVVFGIGYLINVKKLSKIWNKYGQGKIVHTHSLINKNNAWTWDRAKPDDAKDKSPVDYLKKYVSKAQNDTHAQFQYWMTESRFYTYSYSLLDNEKPPIQEPLYVYVGVREVEGAKTLPWHTGDMLYHIPIQGR